MTPSVFEGDPAAADVQLDTQTLTVTLGGERQISVPLSWYPRLLEATEGERDNWELLGDGYAIMQPDLDEHIGVEGLLAGRRSAEKPDSLELPERIDRETFDPGVLQKRRGV